MRGRKGRGEEGRACQDEKYEDEDNGDGESGEVAPLTTILTNHYIRNGSVRREKLCIANHKG